MSPLNYGLTPKMRPLAPKRTALVVALDVGTSKIACLIGRLKPQPPQEVLRRRSHAIEVVGFSHTESRGMKSGHVVDLVAAEEAVRHAVDLAERSAKCQVESVVISMSAGRLTGERLSAAIRISGAAVGDRDIARVLAAGSRQSAHEGRVALHSIPIGFSLDDARGVRDPRGMLASTFGVDMHVVTADAAPARNLLLAVESCHLMVEAMVAGPYVASLATLADDEADLGAAVIDMGAGTTTVAVFADGRFIHADGFTLGGRHVTLDIARGLGTSVQDSERIKTLYGSVLSGGADERDMITVPTVSGEDREAPRIVSRAALTRIIKPRAEEILEMVRDRLAASPFSAEPRGRVVLTGGACQLTGLCDLAARIFGRPVRIGRPLGISGLPEVARGSAFAVAAGLLAYPQAAHLEHFELKHTRQFKAVTGGSYIARVGRWLRESF
jgi:cell division protein FtsA